MLKEIRDFAHFEELCLKLGFTEITRDEFGERLRQLSERPPRPREGRETGFVFRHGGLKVVVWTTYLKDRGKFRKKGTDTGWVLIIQNGKAVHFSRPTRRTKNFLLNLYRRVWINWWRVLKRPPCPECKMFMYIATGPHLKQRYWCCEKKLAHQAKKKHSLDLNCALPSGAKKWLKREYKRRKKYNIRTRKAGKQPYTAMLKRRTWPPAQPEAKEN